MISTEYVLELYRRYQADLQAVRRQQYWFLRKHYNAVTRRLFKMGLKQRVLTPMLDDLEAEVTYLLLRDRNPNVVVEMSPNTGWSTTWMLSALRDNGAKGQLWSYDLHDTCTKFVPKTLGNGSWHFVLGDVRTTLPKPLACDYFFIDSDHTKEFAEWYVQGVLPHLKSPCMLSVHDVYHHHAPSEEGEVVMAWLRNKGLSFWSVAPRASPTTVEAVRNERVKLGMNTRIHPRGKDNPMIFFSLE